MFADKTYLITGASSGIGQALSIEISKQGGNVVMVARNQEKLQETLQQMKEREKHIVYPLDLRNFDEYKMLFDVLKERDITLDGMVHCAGIAPILPLRIVNANQIKNVFDIHYIAFMELIKYFSKRAVNGGSIVGISSVNVEYPQKCMSVYASAKAAVEAACRSLSVELFEKGIRINSVVMGAVTTKMAEKAGELVTGVSQGQDRNNIFSRQLMPFASADEVVGPIMFLLSEQSAYMTGRKIYVDGGLS